uniref:Putative group ii salivary lipocalin n=1 Tax=Amblyomma tuberculatum TaxID=48802 RepID=A0A6M2E3U3_9ACAR
MKTSSLILVLAVLPCFSGEESTAESNTNPLYEEDPRNFPRQKAREAVNFTGRVYIKTINFNLTLNTTCLFSERQITYNETRYLFTLGSTAPNSTTRLATFNTTVDLSITGTHNETNAFTYKFHPGGGSPRDIACCGRRRDSE